MLSPRPQQLPANFTAEKITSNAYTNAQIGYLYNVFTCCYADMYYKFVKSFKRGNNLTVATKQSIAQIKYIQMGLRVLKNWYNPSSVATSASITLTTSFAQSISGNTIAIFVYVTPNPLWATSSLSSLPVIGQVSGYSSFSAAFAALNAIINPKGFNANPTTLAIHETIVTYTSPAVYGNFTQYIIVNYTQTGSAPYNINNYGQFSGGMDIFNPCLTLQQIQQLIENMSKICGCFNCLNTAEILADNNYTPIGQLSNKPSGQVLLPNPVIN